MSERPACNAAMREALRTALDQPDWGAVSQVGDLLDSCDVLPEPDAAASAALERMRRVVLGKFGGCSCEECRQNKAAIDELRAALTRLAALEQQPTDAEAEAARGKVARLVEIALADRDALPSEVAKLQEDLMDHLTRRLRAQPQQDAEVEDETRRILFELAGSASMCWIPKPLGVFDSTYAAHFVAHAMIELSRLRAQPQLPEETT